jgi:hypothetical protein
MPSPDYAKNHINLPTLEESPNETGWHGADRSLTFIPEFNTHWIPFL